MLRIGLTGGIGSGKSTAADIFAELGAYVIDTDIISHQLTQPGTDIFNEIIEHFGETIKSTDGSLDRARLAEVVFSSKQQRSWLEGLLHPAIAKQINLQINSLKQSLNYIILVVPLLIEAGWQDKVDRVCVIDIGVEQQRKRLFASRGLGAGFIDKVIAIQASREKRLALADDIIDNRDNIESLRAQVSCLNSLYCKLAAKGDSK